MTVANMLLCCITAKSDIVSDKFTQGAEVFNNAHCLSTLLKVECDLFISMNNGLNTFNDNVFHQAYHSHLKNCVPGAIVMRKRK